MYAIVEIAGKQYEVEENAKLFVNSINSKEGDKIIFDKVMLLDDEGEVVVGTPAVEGASIEATLLRHVKSDKIIVFKKKRRKGYRVKNGHRQPMSEIKIEKVIKHNF